MQKRKEVKVKLLTEHAQVPRRSYPHDCGLDLYLDKDIKVQEKWTKTGLGIAIAIPSGYFGWITSRSSSLSIGAEIMDGKIDSGYRGEVFVHMKGDIPVTLQRGTRIAQLIIIPYLSYKAMQIKRLPSTTRGERGCGSSGY